MAAEQEMIQRDRREGMRVRGRSRLPAGLGFGGMRRPGFPRYNEMCGRTA
jgi:hypothetical protein